jgi:hypothetical protein
LEAGTNGFSTISLTEPSGAKSITPEEQAQCLLVIIGATPEGKKELIG